MHNKIPTKFYFINSFKKNNIDNLDNNTGLIYRNYNKKPNIEEIVKIKEYCSKKKIKFILSNNLKIALSLNLDGGYIPSFKKDFSHLNYNFKSNFLLLGSAHNLREVRIKEKQKVRIIFISSLFKKNKNFLGIYRFKILSSLTKKLIIALGGITKMNEKRLKILKCYGFSGISYFE
tara:strand:+ start:3679 stop:4206 length:528 start_codon:yes stop_codon:yes gene_type:complete